MVSVLARAMSVSVVTIIGVAVALKAIHVLSLIYKFFLREAVDVTKYGKWAIVTGATDGIGKAWAFELASRGLSVLLISRSEEKLLDVKKLLVEKYPKLQFDHMAVDFSKFNELVRSTVKAKIKSLDVGVLINNVGLSYPFAKYFHELTDTEIADILEVNVSSTMWMSRLVLGDVSENLEPIDGMLKRRRGAIVNTSSGAGRCASPLLAEYSGVKSCIELFSKTLAAELKPKGIDVQVQTPLFVTTKMAKIRKTSLTVPSPEAYVKTAVKQIGYDASISPYWAHSLQLWFQSLLPETISNMIVNSMHQDIRKRGIKKQRESAKDK